ncbi:MAG: hypothetical protein KDD66_09345 [Bdellovibrionales bacterium]|nr:hypothetical protein [Bdellovibrionales bacterium]
MNNRGATSIEYSLMSCMLLYVGLSVHGFFSLSIEEPLILAASAATSTGGTQNQAGAAPNGQQAGAQWGGQTDETDPYEATAHRGNQNNTPGKQSGTNPPSEGEDPGDSPPTFY